MKNFLSALLIFLTLSSVSVAQTIRPNITAEEELEAKKVAVAFFTSYQKTSDIGLLIRHYFVSDFERRLEFCRVTDECGGNNRDFWKVNGILAEAKPTREDYMRHHAVVINVLFLAAQIMNQKARKEDKNLKDYDDEGYVKMGNELLASISRGSRQVYEEMFEGSDNALGGLKSVKNLRERIRQAEKLVTELKFLETSTRIALKRTGKNPDSIFTNKHFRVDDEVNSRRFFDYPVGTKLIEVWSTVEYELPFKIDLISDQGRLKIVAIYPPMD